MNKFTFTSLKFVLFGLFLAFVAVLLLVLFAGQCHRTDSSADDELNIPAVIYLSDGDVSGSDMSGSDISFTDMTEVTE